MERVFTEEELKEMGGRTLDLVLEAIEAGDKERAKKLSNRMYREFLAMHDMYRDWSAGFMNYIYVNYGEETLYKALREVLGPWLKELMESYAKADLRRQVKMLAAGLRGHLQAVKVEEDEEKICITMEPCGSGQRLFESGAYRLPRNLTMIQKPHIMTYGMTDFPVYCTHAPLQEILPMEWTGYPVFVALPAEKMARESCRYCFYKDPKAIPEEIYKRVGKEKPKSA